MRRALLHEHGINSGVSVPIAGRDGRAYGVLGAHTARRRRFGEYDVAFLSRDRHRDRGRDPAPPVGSAPRADDPRAAPSLRQSVRATTRAVLADRAQFAQPAPIWSPNTKRACWRSPTPIGSSPKAAGSATSIADLLRVLLAPYLDRVKLSGPEVFLEPDPTFALGPPRCTSLPPMPASTAAFPSRAGVST